MIKQFLTKFWVWFVALFVGTALAATVVLPNGGEPPVVPEPPTVVGTLFKAEGLGAEDISKRTHFAKDFEYLPKPNTRKHIIKPVPIHYHDGESFKDLPDLSFPEGKEVTGASGFHYVMDLPVWGREELSPDKRILRIYDKKDQPIYIFKNPFVVSKGVEPYEEITIIGRLKPLKRLKTEVIDKTEFVIENHQLYMKIPAVLENSDYPLEMYDDTDTSSTNNKDAQIYEVIADTKYGTSTNLAVESRDANRNAHIVWEWTLSSGSGTISHIKLFTKKQAENNCCAQIDLHELTQAFVEDHVTWNEYDDGSAWTTGGGDYNATIIDSTSSLPTNIGDWLELGLVGTTAVNPISVTWGDTFDILMKYNVEGAAARTYYQSYSKESSGNEPYIEITYTPAGGGRRPRDDRVIIIDTQ